MLLLLSYIFPRPSMFRVCEQQAVIDYLMIWLSLKFPHPKRRHACVSRCHGQRFKYYTTLKIYYTYTKRCNDTTIIDTQ